MQGVLIKSFDLDSDYFIEIYSQDISEPNSKEKDVFYSFLIKNKKTKKILLDGVGYKNMNSIYSWISKAISCLSEVVEEVNKEEI